jgi:hypothetical protein
VQTFDAFPPPRRAPGYPPTSPVPSPRAFERELPTETPIYDVLYSEFRRLFRALPGDRSGEEELRFTGFGHTGSPVGYAAPGVFTPWERISPYPQDSVGYDTAGHSAGRHRSYLSLPPGRG